MLDMVSMYYDSIVKSLRYIIDNPQTKFETEPEDYTVFENLDRTYIDNGCERYLVHTNLGFIEIDFNTNPDDAKYVFDNLDAVDYIYSDRDDCDSIVGDVLSYFNGNIAKCVSYQNKIYSAGCISDILDFLKGVSS